MLQFRIQNDQVINSGEVDKLGIPLNEVNTVFPNDLYDGWFPFTRLCFSLGDWAVISGLPQALKSKFPHLKFALPSRNYLEQIFGNAIGQWKYGDNNPLDYIDYIFKNNPYIYHRFEPGDFDVIFM